MAFLTFFAAVLTALPLISCQTTPTLLSATTLLPGATPVSSQPDYCTTAPSSVYDPRTAHWRDPTDLIAPLP